MRIARRTPARAPSRRTRRRRSESSGADLSRESRSDEAGEVGSRTPFANRVGVERSTTNRAGSSFGVLRITPTGLRAALEVRLPRSRGSRESAGATRRPPKS